MWLLELRAAQRKHLLGALRLLLKFGDCGIRKRSMEAPPDRAVRVEEDDVRVVGCGETGGDLQFRLLVIYQHEPVSLLLRRVASDTVRRHAADQARHGLEAATG